MCTQRGQHTYSTHIQYTHGMDMDMDMDMDTGMRSARSASTQQRSANAQPVLSLLSQCAASSAQRGGSELTQC